MYIYDSVVILSSMWYVLRFEHAHGLKRYNDRRMTRGQSTCSLGGTASLGLLLPSISFFQFLLPFSRKRLLLRWIVDIVKGIRSLLFFCFWLFSQHLLLCHVMKMCHVCYYNNSDATFRLLMSGDINPNPGPVSASTAGKINCLVMNAGSLKSYHKDSTTNWQSMCNLHRFQDLVYAETLTLYASVRHG